MTDVHQEMEREKESGPTQDQNPDMDLIEDIRLTISKLGPKLSSECCIYRVPRRLRDVNPAAYTPHLVSIGPLHHGNRAVKKLETQKVRYLEYFLEVVEPACLDELVSHIRKEVTRIRECYAESIVYPSSDDQFVKMVLVDAAFIIMLFIRDCQEKGPDDYLIFDNGRMRGEVRRDLILLENQLPFFILKDLYDLAFTSYRKHFPSFADLTLDFFSYHNQQNKKFAEHTKHFPSFADFTLGYFNRQDKEFPEDTKHFTDLLRYFHLPLPPSEDSSSPTYLNCCNHYKSLPGKVKNFIQPLTSFLHLNHKLGNKNENRGVLKQKTESLYSATELQEAGVKFQMSGEKSIFEIHFRKGTLVMPRLAIEHTTECFFGNLIAMEQLHYPQDAQICDYIVLMDYLINTYKDVELLVQKKIILNRLGDHRAVSILFNRLGTGISNVRRNHYYSKLFVKLNEYCEVPYHKWGATLRLEYFKTPFRAASTIAAIILLVLTAIQTVYSVIGK